MAVKKWTSTHGLPYTTLNLTNNGKNLLIVYIVIRRLT